MSHAGVMVRCPTTGRELSTGVEMDTATFERLPDIHSRIKCPLCRGITTGQLAKPARKFSPCCA
jgi:hypothetical protein